MSKSGKPSAIDPLGLGEQMLAAQRAQLDAAEAALKATTGAMDLGAKGLEAAKAVVDAQQKAVDLSVQAFEMQRQWLHFWGFRW